MSPPGVVVDAETGICRLFQACPGRWGLTIDCPIGTLVADVLKGRTCTTCATDEREASHVTSSEGPSGQGPLAGLKVIDAAVLFAGPVIGTLLADFGADVIKVEHPKGDALRTLGWQKDGVSLWWAFVSRNKRLVSIDFGEPEGAALLKELVKDADVLIESFRPGTFERWGLGPDVLHAINPGLVMVRCSGYGQTGPYSPRPGFGTVAESISGYAHINGQPDGPPTLPPFALGDGVASMFGTFATMFALWHRNVNHGPGQVIDLAIYEPLFWLLGPQALVYDQLGYVQNRTGSSTDWTAPRNAYQTSDGKWLGMSASSQSIAERVMKLVGHAEVVQEPWFADHAGRVEHQDLLNEYIGGLDRGAYPTGGHGRLRVAAGGGWADLLHRGHLQGSAVHRARHHHHGRRPAPGQGARPERHPAADPDTRQGPPSRRRPGPGQSSDPGTELGHSDADLERLQAAGIVGGRPLTGSGPRSTTGQPTRGSVGCLALTARVGRPSLPRCGSSDRPGA